MGQCSPRAGTRDRRNAVYTLFALRYGKTRNGAAAIIHSIGLDGHVIANVLQSVRDGVREFFLLEKAEQKLATIDSARREIVRSYYEAGNRRLNVAQDLRGPVQTPAALTLYRQGSHFLALSYLASHGFANLDRVATSLDETFRELDRAFAADGVNVPAAYDRARPILVALDPLELDRLSPEEAARRVEELEAASRWLTSLVDARTPSQLRWMRVFRIGSVVIGTVVVLVLLVLRLIAPKNYALDKPATASSYMFQTVAAGAVDGSKNGVYGYHSLLEESPWLSIDLVQPVAITKIKVFGRGDGYYDQSIPLSLEVSDDATNYQQIGLRSEPFSERDPWVVQPVGVVARYLRLKTMRQSYLVLGEVEVNGSVPKK